MCFSCVCTWVKVLGVKLGLLHAQVGLSFQDCCSGCFGNSVKWNTKCLLTVVSPWLGETANAVADLVTRPWLCDFDRWECAASNKRRMNWHGINKRGCCRSVRVGVHVQGTSRVYSLPFCARSLPLCCRISVVAPVPLKCLCIHGLLLTGMKSVLNWGFTLLVSH